MPNPSPAKSFWSLPTLRSVPAAPYVCALLGLFLLLFNSFNAAMVSIDYESPAEIAYMWSDEGLHAESILRMQAQQTMELKHHAYTGMYSNFSYALSWLLSAGTPITLQEFALGSLLTSSVLMQATIVAMFLMLWHLLRSPWVALLGAVLFGTFRWVIFHSAVMHPEAPMLLGIVLAIWGTADFSLQQNTRGMLLAGLGCGMAVAGKLQGVLIAPSCALIFVSVLLTTRARAAHVAQTIGYGSVAFAGALFVFSPYQILHWERLLTGIQTERMVQTTSEDLSTLKWMEYLVSNEYLGYAYTLLLVVTVGLLGWQRAQLDRTQRVLLLNAGAHVCFGLLYVVISVHNLIARYLVHTIPALTLLLFLLATFVLRLPASRWRVARWLVGLLLVVGIQQQIKHADFDFVNREARLQRITEIHQLQQEVATMAGERAKVLGLGFAFLRPTEFSFRTSSRSVDLEGYEYVLLRDIYPQVIRREGAQVVDPEEREDRPKRVRVVEQLQSGGYELVGERMGGRVKIYRKI
jgi:hypothetical protein